jgi:hypothetical protein
MPHNYDERLFDLSLSMFMEALDLDNLDFDDKQPMINTSNKYNPVRGNVNRHGDWDNPRWFDGIQTHQANRRWRKMGRYNGLVDLDVFECQARSLIGWTERYYW